VWPASHITLGGQPCVGTILKTVLSTCPKEAVLKVSNAQRWCKEETWQPGQVAWPASLTSGPHAPNLWPQHRLTPPINTMVLPPAERVKRVRFSPLECSQDHSCRVERGEVLRAGGLLGLSGVLGIAQARKLYRNPFGFDGVFRALVRSSAEALPEFSKFRQRADSRVPQVYLNSNLSGYP
jgi:hypothetical protein